MTLTPTTYKDVRGYRDEAGKFLPASGSVLDLLFPGQMQWIDQAALDEGTKCHEDMQRACEVAIATGTWHASDNPRVQALIEYLEANNFIPLETEQARCTHLYGYAGRPDALLKRGKTFVVPDWKFAESIDERYRYQLQSYERFDWPFEHPRPTMILFQVNREAKVKLSVVGPDARRWALFLNALAVLKFRLQ